jgi:iron-sulfur cluster repair protein YtfE (RIC family)
MITQPPDDIVRLLLEDHHAVKSRFAEVASVTPEERAERFWKLTDELVRHEVAEEVVLYPVIRQLPHGVAVAEARISEQSEAEQQLKRMEKLEPTSPEFMAELTDLKAAVMDHAEREELEVLPLLTKEASSERLVQMGQRYTAAKASAPNHPHPHAPHTPPGSKLVAPVAALIDRIRDTVS